MIIHVGIQFGRVSNKGTQPESMSLTYLQNFVQVFQIIE